MALAKSEAWVFSSLHALHSGARTQVANEIAVVRHSEEMGVGDGNLKIQMDVDVVCAYTQTT